MLRTFVLVRNLILNVNICWLFNLFYAKVMSNKFLDTHPTRPMKHEQIKTIGVEGFSDVLIYYVVDKPSKDHQYTMLYGFDKTKTIYMP